jgi:hypothetical protein
MLAPGHGLSLPLHPLQAPGLDTDRRGDWPVIRYGACPRPPRSPTAAVPERRDRRTRTSHTKCGGSVVLISNRTPKPPRALGLARQHDDSGSSARCPIECPINARPGLSEKKKIPLECGIADGETRTRTGDTTISVMGRNLSNSGETPAISPFLATHHYRLDLRKLQSLLVALGTGTRFSAQSRGRSDSASPRLASHPAGHWAPWPEASAHAVRMGGAGAGLRSVPS